MVPAYNSFSANGTLESVAASIATPFSCTLTLVSTIWFQFRRNWCTQTTACTKTCATCKTSWRSIWPAASFSSATESSTAGTKFWTPNGSTPVVSSSIGASDWTVDWIHQLVTNRNFVVGLMNHSDPADYSDMETEQYPYSWFLPGEGVQRGTVVWRDGDSSTPMYPALRT